MGAKPDFIPLTAGRSHEIPYGLKGAEPSAGLSGKSSCRTKDLLGLPTNPAGFSVSRAKESQRGIAGQGQGKFNDL